MTHSQGHSATCHSGHHVATRTVRSGGLAALAIGTGLVGRNRMLRWGTDGDEGTTGLAGDDILPKANLTATRAIGIAASPEDVWPWLAQIGQGRGGFYSYEFLENVIGRADIHNAHRIVPQWQEVRVGDQVRLHPEIALAVVDLRPGSHLVLRGAVPMGDVAPPYDFTWAFCLRRQLDGSTRLLIRERYTDTRWWARPLVEVVSIVAFAMTQRMLRGIRDRAQSTSVPRQDLPARVERPVA